MMDINDFRNADAFDMCDLIGRIDELKEAEPIDAEEAEELASLTKFVKDLKDYVEDYPYGPVIAESYFETYAQEYAEECGLIPDDAAWPMTCIDWRWAARELRHDYTEITWEGRSYLTQ